ncbi:MAG TPA: hypothetical protein VEB40_00620, partial [Flavipsychrobacter sp.]|nr:hypothetical protein [Flavipsychrobacter sp.]
MSRTSIRRIITLHFLLLVTLLKALQGIAQDKCHCPIEKQFADINAKLRQTNNTERIESRCRELTGNKSPACRRLGYHSLGVLYFHQNKAGEALTFLEQERGLLDSLGCDSQMYIDYYLAVGNCYFLNNDPETAIRWYLKMLSASEAAKDTASQAMSLLNIAVVFSMEEQKPKAFEYTKKVIPLIGAVKNKNEQGGLLAGVAGAYIDFGDLTKSMKYLDTAEYFAKRAIDVFRDLKNNKRVMGLYVSLSHLYDLQGKPAKCLVYADSAITLSDPSIDRRQLFAAYFNKASTYRKLGQLQRAIQFTDSALKYALAFGHYKNIGSAYDLKYELDTATGNYKAALEAYIRSRTISDSILTAEKSKSI